MRTVTLYRTALPALTLALLTTAPVLPALRLKGGFIQQISTVVIPKKIPLPGYSEEGVIFIEYGDTAQDDIQCWRGRNMC
jgi:hypothetical protein